MKNRDENLSGTETAVVNKKHYGVALDHAASSLTQGSGWIASEGMNLGLWGK